MRRRRDPLHIDPELLLQLGLGVTDAGEQQSAAGHLQQCARCRAELQSIEQFQKVMAGLPFENPPAACWEEVRQQVLQNFRNTHPRQYPEAIVGLIESARNLWNWALEDPMVAVSYLAIALAYLSYSFFTTTPLQSTLPQAGQLMQLLKLAF